MNKEDKVFILDTSAFFTYLEDEEDADYIQNLLEKAENGEAVIYISFISLTEVYYITLQERDAAEASDRISLIRSLASSVCSSDALRARLMSGVMLC